MNLRSFSGSVFSLTGLPVSKKLFPCKPFRHEASVRRSCSGGGRLKDEGRPRNGTHEDTHVSSRDRCVVRLGGDGYGDRLDITFYQRRFAAVIQRSDPVRRCRPDRGRHGCMDVPWIGPGFARCAGNCPRPVLAGIYRHPCQHVGVPFRQTCQGIRRWIGRAGGLLFDLPRFDIHDPSERLFPLSLIQLDHAEPHPHESINLMNVIFNILCELLISFIHIAIETPFVGLVRLCGGALRSVGTSRDGTATRKNMAAPLCCFRKSAFGLGQSLQRPLALA